MFRLRKQSAHICRCGLSIFTHTYTTTTTTTAILIARTSKHKAQSQRILLLHQRMQSAEKLSAGQTQRIDDRDECVDIAS